MISRANNIIHKLLGELTKTESSVMHRELGAIGLWPSHLFAKTIILEKQT